MRQLKNKTRPGAYLAVMYADAEKYARSEPEQLASEANFREYGARSLPDLLRAMHGDADGLPRPARWYWIGIARFLRPDSMARPKHSQGGQVSRGAIAARRGAASPALPGGPCRCAGEGSRGGGGRKSWPSERRSSST